MTTAPAPGANRLLELLADRAVQGLGAIDAAELDVLLRRDPEASDSLDLAAAAADLAMLGGAIEPMPERLRRNLSDMGRVWQAAEPEVSRPRSRQIPRRLPMIAWTGWIAAAAAVALAATGWWMRPMGSRSATESLRALRSRATDLQTLPWAAGPSEAPPGATGEVVWSPSLQEGYMVFRNVKPNNPSTEQYQLWVFDAARDERFPVDGGVFDVASTGECVVPIHTSVKVEKATLFAVTIERPGGVVVSDRSRLPLVAMPPKGG